MSAKNNVTPKLLSEESGKKVFTSCLAILWVSALIVDSIFPTLVSFFPLMVLSFAPNFA